MLCKLHYTLPSQREFGPPVSRSIWFPSRCYELKSHSLSIRRFWGKGERWKQKLETGEGEKRLTQMLLLEPSTPTQHDSIPSNQNHFRSLGSQIHVSKSSPEINLTLPSGRAPVLVLLLFRLFSETSNEEFSNKCNGKPAVFEEL